MKTSAGMENRNTYVHIKLPYMTRNLEICHIWQFLRCDKFYFRRCEYSGCFSNQPTA